MAVRHHACGLQPASEVHAKLIAAGVRADLDLRNEKINYKVREHSHAKVPLIFVCGKREAEEQAVNVRRLGSQHPQGMALADALAMVAEEIVPPDVKRKRAGQAEAAE